MTSFNLPLPLCFLCLPGEKLEGKKTIICIANEKHQKVSENVSLPKISIHLVDFFLIFGLIFEPTQHLGIAHHRFCSSLGL